jgi:hypothetical protein
MLAVVCWCDLLAEIISSLEVTFKVMENKEKRIFFFLGKRKEDIEWMIIEHSGIYSLNSILHFTLACCFIVFFCIVQT